jgi:hypothetical protein
VTADFRCSVAAESRGDDLAGTATTVSAFLLMEHAGPWGAQALRDSRLPAALGPALQRHAARARVRPLLIRRSGRTPPTDGVRLFVASTRADDPWVETAVVPDLEAVLDLDLVALAAGRSLGLERVDGPLFAVCTHGRHDPCCAERGRPVALALTDAEPEATWECSHVGGDRFAGNVLVLPHGLYYGRLDPASAVALATGHRAGRLDLEHLRGRSQLSMPAQVAEIALRRRLGESRIAAVVPQGQSVTDGTTAARFAVDGAAYVVTVRSAATAEREQLTCRTPADSPLPIHEVLSIERLARPVSP